jgi:hypothetical protein
MLSIGISSGSNSTHAIERVTAAWGKGNFVTCDMELLCFLRQLLNQKGMVLDSKQQTKQCTRW